MPIGPFCNVAPAGEARAVGTAAGPVDDGIGEEGSTGEGGLTD